MGCDGRGDDLESPTSFWRFPSASSTFVSCSIGIKSRSLMKATKLSLALDFDLQKLGQAVGSLNSSPSYADHPPHVMTSLSRGQAAYTLVSFLLKDSPFVVDLVLLSK